MKYLVRFILAMTMMPVIFIYLIPLSIFISWVLDESDVLYDSKRVIKAWFTWVKPQRFKHDEVKEQ